jgi:hypothetical protein
MTRRASSATASLSCAAAARELGVAPNTVRHGCREGWLRKHARVTESGSYRIPRRVFDAILAGELSPPKPQRRG